MAILTIIPSLNTLGNSFISLLFPNQCLVCKDGEFFSQDPICLICLQHMTLLPIGNRVEELTVNDGIGIALSGWDFGNELRTAIHSLKCEDRARIGSFLDQLLGDKLQKNNSAIRLFDTRTALSSTYNINEKDKTYHLSNDL